jgi:hypothetical protein
MVATGSVLSGFGGGAITAGARNGASPARPGDRRHLPLDFLVEDVLGLRLRQGLPGIYSIERRVVPRNSGNSTRNSWLRRVAAVHSTVDPGRRSTSACKGSSPATHPALNAS